MSDHIPRLRQLIRAWANSALSEAVREYKLQRLSEAFALPDGYLARYMETGHSMGIALVIEIDTWVRQNWDLSPNSPAPDHFLSGVNTNDG